MKQQYLAHGQLMLNTKEAHEKEMAQLQSRLESSESERAKLYDQAKTEIEELRRKIEQLVQVNGRTGMDMEVEAFADGGSLNRDVAELKEMIRGQQTQMNQMIHTALTSAKQLISEMIDTKIASKMLNMPVNSSQTATLSPVLHTQHDQQQLLKRTTGKTFAECLHKNAPVGKFSVNVPEDTADVINKIEEDEDLVKCGRCNVIERRTPNRLLSHRTKLHLHA